MKKIMICAVTLLPLIILLILSVSGVVVGLSTYIYVEYIEFVDDEVVLEKTSDDEVTKELKVNVFPMRAQNKQVEYWSGDESIATIDSNGVVHGIDFGETYIYAKSKENETKRATCKVIITDSVMHKVYIENPIDTIYVGESFYLKSSYYPDDIENPKLIWTSSDESILAVSADGTITAGYTQGLVTITVKSEANPKAYTSIDVRVKKKLDAIALEDSSPVITGKSIYTFPTILSYPTDAYAHYNYTSSDEEVATVDNSGNVTFNKAGTVIIYATEDGGLKVSKQVTSTNGYFTDVSFNENVLDIDYVSGGEIGLITTYYPVDGNTENLSITSSNTSVVKIVDNKAIMVGGGTAKITATIKTSENTTKEALCTVNVNRKADNIVFYNSANKATNYYVVRKKTTEISKKIIPTDNTDNIVSYVSSDESVATVANGVVQFLTDDYGKVDVTLTTRSGLSRVVTIVYLGDNVKPIAIKKGENQASITMPNSINEQVVYYTPYLMDGGINSIEYIVSNDVVENNNEVCKVVNSGTSVITIKVNGEDYATVNVKSVRYVERIDNLTFTEIFDGSSSIVVPESNKIKTAAKKINFSFDLYPVNTTTTKLSAVVTGDAGYVAKNANSIIFEKAGSIKIVFSADSVKYTITVESTYEMPSKDTTTLTNLSVFVGDELTSANFVSELKPSGADISNITIKSKNNAVLENASGKLISKKGGDAYVVITLNTYTGVETRDAIVHINERIASIDVPENYVYITSATIDVTTLYSINPISANYETGITYLQTDGTSIASLSGTTLTFTEAGLASVKVSTENGIDKIISIIYVGKNSVVDGSDDIIDIKLNDTIIIKPSLTLRNSVSDGTEFEIAGGATLTNGIIIKVTESATDENANITLNFGDTTYYIRGVILSTAVSVDIKNSTDADKISDYKYVTGLMSIELLGAVQPSNATNKVINYSVSDTSVAEMSGSTVVFKKAGTVTITAQNSEGKSGTVEITSTYGALNNVLLSKTNLTYDFDNTGVANVKDLTSLFTGSPSQIEISSTNIELLTSSNVISVSGLSITLLKGGNAVIYVKIVGEDETVATINVSIERDATTLLLNGVDIDTLNTSEDLHSAMKPLKVTYSPADATKNLDVSYSIISGESYATIINNKLVFSAINEDVIVRFTLGSGLGEKTWDITYSTDNLAQLVDIDVDTIIAPVNDKFVFYSESGKTFTINSFTSIVIGKDADNNYSASASGVGEVNITIDGISTTKTIIITERVEEITGVKLDDEKNNVAVLVDISKNALHKSASKTYRVYHDSISYALNKDGNIPSVVIISSDTSVATVSGDEITFNTYGTVTITIKVTGSDFYGEYVDEYSFEIYSTYGRVDDFTLDNPYHEGIIIDNVTTFDLFTCISVTSPEYGALMPTYTFTSGNESIFTVDENGIVTVVGTGVGTLEVKTYSGTNVSVVRSITIKVDKYIDTLYIRSGDAKILSKVTHNEVYALDIAKLSDTSVDPTLLGVDFSILSGTAAIDSFGNVTISNVNEEVVIKVLAKQGSAECTFKLVRVPETTEIIVVNNTTTKVAIQKNVSVVFDCQFDTFVSYDVSGYAPLVVDNATANSFKGTYGAFISFALDNTKVFDIVVVEGVSEIRLKDDAPSNGYLTAQGEEGIDLSAMYGAYFLPSSARNEDGKYEIEYSVTNVSGEATVTNGILTFTKAGVVEITFRAGDKSITRTIESTMGYAKSVTVSGITTSFEKTTGTYTITSDKYIVTPSNATKQNIFLTSSDEDVFTVSSNVLTFVGGGTAKLYVNYYTGDGVYKTEGVSIFVNNRATGIDVYDGAEKVKYIVANENFTIDARALFSGTQLSSYSFSYTSSDETILTVDNSGNVTFLTKEVVAQIVIKAINGNDSAVDAQTTISVVCTDDNIARVTTTNDIEIELVGKKMMLYPVSNDNDAEYTYNVTSGNDVITITSGEISVLKGGYAEITITNESGYNGVVSVFVHQVVSEITISNANLSSDFLTSLTTHTIGAEMMPVDARYNKTLAYEYDDTIASISSDGVVTFKKEGKLVITIKAMYDDVVECVKVVTIDCTYGGVRSYSLQQKGVNVSNGETLTIPNINESIALSVTNILPLDYVGNVTAVTTNADAHNISISGNNITILGKKKGQGNVTISIGGVSYIVNVVVNSKSTSISVTYNDSAITSIETIGKTIRVGAVIYPLDATDTTFTLSIDGGASISSDGTIDFTGCEYKTYTVTATANDGASVGYASVIYKQDITSFGIKYMGEEVANGSTIHLDWNVENATFTIMPIPSNVAGVDFANFTITSTNGSTYTRNGQAITITTLSRSTNPNFTDIIRISYKSVYVFEINISRFGIKSVNFGNHDNTLDSEYGLQQMRLFGNQSYYDGAIRNYYDMTLNVEPTNFDKSKLIWTTSNSNVTVAVAGENARVTFGSGFNTNTRDNISNDDFESRGVVTVFAKDDQGNVLCSYTFHTAPAVNVFDEAGFMNGGINIVLQKNFGHDYEINQGMSNCVKLDNYTSKTSIYGNGYLINYAYRNSQTSDETLTNSGYLDCRISYAYNVVFRGVNIGTADDDMHTEIKAAIDIRYCEMTYFYCGIDFRNNGGKVRNSLIRSIYYQGMVNNSASGSIYAEDIVMFDCGATAINLEKPTLYMKGFLDIYNYQNKNKLIKVFKDIPIISNSVWMADRIIKTIADNNEGYATDPDETTLYYTNIVIVGTQKTSPTTLMFYDKSNGSYVESTDGTAGTMEGLKRLDVGVLVNLVNQKSDLNVYVWALPANLKGYPLWSEQYNSDGSVNYSILANKEQNILRSYRVNNPL